jgi:hypothetical protein
VGRKARRTRAVSEFLSARPAAFRTNTGLDSLASSEASVCMYPGCERTREVSESENNKKKRGMGAWAMKGDAHNSPGKPALAFAWHFHA